MFSLKIHDEYSSSSISMLIAHANRYAGSSPGGFNMLHASASIILPKVQLQNHTITSVRSFQFWKGRVTEYAVSVAIQVQQVVACNRIHQTASLTIILSSCPVIQVTSHPTLPLQQLPQSSARLRNRGNDVNPPVYSLFSNHHKFNNSERPSL